MRSGTPNAIARSRTTVAAAALALACAAASAQRLNLGAGPSAPAPGDGRAVLALADLLEGEAQRLGADAPGGALRSLAADLLRDGENAGAPGSPAVLAGLTLASKREAFDGVVAGLDDATGAYIVGVVARSERSILPREVDLLLRDALAPLATGPDPACGWWRPATPEGGFFLGDSLDRLREVVGDPHLTDGAAEALAGMIELLERSDLEPAYARDTADWARLLVGASGVLGEPPTWLEMPARDRLREGFSGAAALCLVEPGRSRELLARSASLARVVAGTDALDARHQSRELREAVNRLAAAPEGDPKSEPEAVARIADTYLRALDLITAADRAPAPGELVRQCRPMLGPLADAHGQAAGAVVRLLPRILNEPDPMTDPGVLAAMGSLQRAADDLDLAGSLSDTLASWVTDPSQPLPAPMREPVATRDAGPLAERVRQLGVSLGREDERDAALLRLRALDGLATTARRMPGEAELRAEGGSAIWRRVTGDQADRLVFLVTQARSDWLQSAAIEQFADRHERDETRVRALAAVLTLVRDAAAVDTMRADWARNRPPPIHAWPGVELTPRSLDVIADGLAGEAARLAVLAARGDSDAAALRGAQGLTERHAAAIALGRLGRLTANAPACDVVAELGLGTATDGAWMVEHRGTLAAVCRSAYEAAAADGDRRGVFLEHANRVALPLLDAIR